MEAEPIKIPRSRHLKGTGFQPSHFKIKSQFDHSLGFFSVDLSRFNSSVCKLSPVRSIGDNDFLRVISWACWYYHPLLVLVNYLLCYVAIYIC